MKAVSGIYDFGVWGGSYVSELENFRQFGFGFNVKFTIALVQSSKLAGMSRNTTAMLVGCRVPQFGGSQHAL